MSVELLDHMGDDIAVVNAARVSYGKQSTWTNTCRTCGFELSELHDPSDHVGGPSLSKSDAGLINYLMKNRHGTPFEMVVFKFRVSTPIKVAREWQRHRIGSYNEVSTRYVEMTPLYYVPKNHDVRIQTGKPGHYVMEQASEELAGETVERFLNAYYAIGVIYRAMLQSGVAKELASFILPMGQMTEFIWTVNLRSLFNFMSLRSHETALLEIRRESQRVEEHVKHIVPYAFEAWENNGRHAP